jgi:hypothetical protein
MATSRCFDCGEELDVALNGARHQEGSKYRHPASGLDTKHHVAAILPNASRTWPPAQGDYPEWTDEEIRAEVEKRHVAEADPEKRKAIADKLVSNHNSGVDYNESMLTKAERIDRSTIGDDLAKLSNIQTQISTARKERAARLLKAEQELAGITAANEAERKMEADKSAAEIKAAASESGDPNALEQFKQWQEAQSAARTAKLASQGVDTNA